MNTLIPSSPSRAGALALVLLLGGCASGTEPGTPATPAPETPAPENYERAEVTEEASGEVAVIAVNRETRTVTFERADGLRASLVCGPEIRNFDRINAGDKVKVQWRMTLMARRLRPDELDTPASGRAAAARAPEGGEPAAAVAAGVAMTVRVESVDAANHVVVITNAAGQQQTVKAKRDEGKRFVETLKVGDRVEIIHLEGVALNVE